MKAFLTGATGFVGSAIIRVDIVGNVHHNNLRMNDLENRFPGLMPAVLRAVYRIYRE